MNKGTLIIFCGFVASSLLISCETTLELDATDVPQKTVVNTSFEVGQPIRVVVTQSRNPFDNVQVEYLSDAIVKLYESGTELEQFQPKDRELNTDYPYFESRFKPKANVTYTLKVYTSNGDSVLSSDAAPRKIIPSNLTHTNFQINTIPSKPNVEVYSTSAGLTFTDRPDEDNYFHIKGYAEILDIEAGDTLYETPRLVEVSLNALYNSGTIFKHHNGGLLLDDKTNNGGVFDIPFAFVSGELNTTTTYCKRFLVELRTVSNAYYQYQTSVSKQLTANNPLSDPTLVYNNIQNGLGIFAGYSSSTQELIVR